VSDYDFIPANKVRQVLILAFLLVFGFILYREMAFMLSAGLGAIALYMLLRIPMFKLVFNFKWKVWLSALVLILSSLIVVVVPFVFVFNTLVAQLSPYLQNTQQLTKAVEQIEVYVFERTGVDILSSANLSKIPALLSSVGSSVIGSTLSAATNLIITYFLLWFMLTNGGSMERWLRRHLPFKSTNTSKLLQEVRSMVVSNAVGIPLLGAIQGIVAAVGYYLFGVTDPVLWGIMTGVASVIPFVGTMAVWVPLVILKFAAGEMSHAYWLLFWGLGPIGSSDNVIRFALQKPLPTYTPSSRYLG
jgi:predicted PurR-regulated permease PerM